jgi:uncharacterized protein
VGGVLLVFVGLVLVMLCLVHFYLWKRLVQDPLVGRLQRRVGAVVAVVLALLVPVTLIGARTGWAKWVAWPGFLWIALMFYLLVTLVVLEIPRLAIVLLWRRRSRRADQSAGSARTGTDGAQAVADTPGSPTPTRDEISAGHEDSTDRAIPPSQESSTDRTTPPGHESSTNRTTPPDHEDSTDRVIAPGQKVWEETATQDAGHEGSLRQDAGRDVAAGHQQQHAGSDPAGQMDRRLVLARGMAIFAGLTAAGITGYGVKTALGPPQVNRVRIPLAKLPRRMDQTRLALVSDIHLGPLTGTQHVGRIVELINSVDADFVCIVGDLVDGTVAELGRFAAPLRDIESRRGAYFVTGNHEYYSGFQPWVDEVARLGVRPLRNERVELDGLDLAGVNDLGGAEHHDGPDFARALGDRDGTRPVVLMAHQPIVARQAAPFGVDLQVSGHTHGGQMAPFNLLVKLQQPVVSGLGEVDGVPVFVTNGAGFWGPPVRVGAPPQVTVIELRTP